MKGLNLLTRLKTDDIEHIKSSLDIYDRQLKQRTGRTLLGTACHAAGVDEDAIIERTQGYAIHVVPITGGLGIISDFSETVSGILDYLGFNAAVAPATDVTGVAHAFESGAHAVMMADDHRFVAIDLYTRQVVDNSEATGRVFAAALELMADESQQTNALILGCGPVGEAAARYLRTMDYSLCLYDIRPEPARALKERLEKEIPDRPIRIETDLAYALTQTPLVIEATPAAEAIPDHLITDHLRVSAPGVPLGVTPNGELRLKDRLVHDKLELGVAAMAVSLLANSTSR